MSLQEATFMEDPAVKNFYWRGITIGMLVGAGAVGLVPSPYMLWAVLLIVVLIRVFQKDPE